MRAEDNEVFATSTLSRWSHNDVGMAWLQQVFDRYTKQKASSGRQWHLLILDGHASHIKKMFIDYCNNDGILLCVFPPHSTYSLQPLDVALFKPVASAYSNQLDAHLQRGQVLVPIRKRDLFLLL